MRSVYIFILAAMCCPLAANPAFAQRIIPDCAGRTEISNARVIRVERNGALILSDGRAVLLEGIRLPQAEAEGGPRYLADGALSVLTELASQGPVTFTATPPKQDRYDRVRAQGFNRTWLQVALLEQGLARVAISPDREECSPELYEAEGKARARRAGIWAITSYAPRTPQAMKGTTGTFQVVEGWVTNVGSRDGRIFIDFGNDWPRGFSAAIAPEDRRAFRGYDLESLHAKHVRIRGIVQEARGRPHIVLSNPAQIELLN
jgi:endonuclease YncB( thermonuclease family)